MAARVELESTGLSQAQSISNRPQCQIMLTSLYWQRRGSSNPQTLTGRQALARLRNTKLCLLLYVAEGERLELSRPYGLHRLSRPSPYLIRATFCVGGGSGTRTRTTNKGRHLTFKASPLPNSGTPPCFMRLYIYTHCGDREGILTPIVGLCRPPPKAIWLLCLDPLNLIVKIK